MSFFATEPMTFTAARDFLAQKVNLPTQLGSLDLSLKVPARIRAQAFFSARVASANIVQGLRTEVEAVARGDYNYAEARGRLTTFLARQGYGIPDVGTKADQDLTNLASTRRLDLILRQNVAMAHAVGQREVAENPAVMEDLPCYEYLPSGAQHPRTEHMQFYGLILPKNDPFWATHYPPWEFGCDCAIGQTDAPPNAKTSGFKPGAPMDGHLDYNGRMTQLTGNESGFEFDSTPAAAFAEPDFSRIEDPDLRGQVETAFQQKFSMVKLSALTPAARKIKGSSEKPVALPATEAQAIHDWSSPEFEPMRTAMQASEAGLSADPAALEKVAQLRSALQRLPAEPGLTYRGLSFDTAAERQAVLALYQAGHLIRWSSFAATSQLEDVALHYARKKPAGLTFIITGRNGRAVWRYCKKPKEREVLFPEGTWFRVDNVVGERIFLTEMVRHE